MDDGGDIKALVVNDSPDQLVLMRTILRKAGYRVLTAADGREAFEMALREPVGIIVSDVMMPNVDGIELCRLVRGHPALKTIPLVLVSALRKGTENVVEGLRSGADGYVESPFDPMHLIAVITRLIERARVERKLRESERRFRQLAENIHEVFWVSDPNEGAVLYVSPAYEEIWGRTCESLYQRPLSYLEAVHPEDEERGREAYELQRRGERTDKEYRIVRPDGSVRWIHDRAFPVKDDAGKLIRVVGIAEDITERKRAEEQVSELNRDLEQRVAERTAQLEHEVAERKAVEVELEKARDAALVAARLKSEFLANVSHEIRTPMHAVLGMAALLMDSPLRPRQREFVESIKESTDSLLSIINDVLDLSKTDAGKLRLGKTDFDLKDVVEASVHMFVDRARAKGLALECIIGDEVPTLLSADPGRLRQVLVNLLSNAVKFTESGGVTLEVTRTREEQGQVTLRFEVRDTGIGVRAEDLRRIFLPFAQADGSDTRAYGGTGLGLAISRQLVELMGGEIGVTSEPGKGSTFWFTAALAEQAGATQPAGQAGLAGLRALVFDPDEINRETVVRQTSEWGMRPSGTGDSERALELLREAAAEGDPFVFVLLGLLGSRGEGVELARQVRADAGLRGTLLVLITSSVLGQEEEAEFERLFDIFLTIPMRRQQLNASLLALLNRSGAPASHQEAPAARPASLGQGQSILVAEDNTVNQKLMTYLLEELGYEAVVVPNGAVALEVFAPGKYPLVLMDCQMPVMDGYAAVAEMRRREGSFSRTPVVALTADAMLGTRERCLAAGMDDYLSKPFTREELGALIARWITGSNAQAAAQYSRADDVLDLSLMDRLRGMRARGDADAAAQLLDSFLQDVNARRDSIREALKAGDSGRVRREAHALKGSSGFFGAVRLSKVCADLVFLADCGDLTSAHGLLKGLDDELLSVTRRLAEWRRAERG